ncbi:hypothetical protein [Burkholderia alba]|uniref:hypothetical protein n=1 Tax=Burkholderia alba TaxID=2683677 RepID=UPI002B05E37E|nr:hypothetical protein [Burkholderia alba]
MPPPIDPASRTHGAPPAIRGGARRASDSGGVLAADVARVTSARRHSMPNLGGAGDAQAGRAGRAPAQSFRQRLAAVSSRNPRESPASAERDAAPHGATSLEQARAHLNALAADHGGALSAFVAQLNDHDRRALDHLALTVHALHLTVDDARAPDAFASIGKALASFLTAAARPGVRLRDLCVEGNKSYRTLCECVAALLRDDGVADAMFGHARERGDAAAADLVSARLGGRMDGEVRVNGMVNRHGGDAQLRMAAVAQRFALGARHATNLVDMAGTTLDLLGRTDQLLNGVARRMAPPEPGCPRPPGGEPASPNATGPVSPVVVNNYNTVNVNLDGLERLVGDLGRMMDALLTRMESSRAPEAARPAEGAGPGVAGSSGATRAHSTHRRFGDAPTSSFAETRADGRIEAPADPRVTSRADPPASSTRHVAGGVSTSRLPAGGNGIGVDGARNGAWRPAVDGGWRMGQHDPIVRTTEGATRLDPFSRVGPRVAGASRADAVGRGGAEAPNTPNTPNASSGSAGAVEPRPGSHARANGPTVIGGWLRDSLRGGWVKASGDASSGATARPGSGDSLAVPGRDTPAAASVPGSAADRLVEPGRPVGDAHAAPPASAPRAVEPRRMNRAQLERAGRYPLVDDDAPPTGAPETMNVRAPAKVFPTVRPADRIVTTEGPTRVGWADSIDGGTAR